MHKHPIDMINLEHIREVSKRLENLYVHLDIERKKLELSNEEKKISDPNLWDSPKKAKILMKQMRQKKKWVEEYTEIVKEKEDLEIIYDFWKDGEVDDHELEQAHDKVLALIEKLEFKNMLSGQEDSLDAVVQITAGAGGTESCDWAYMLMRMYIMWGEKNGHKVKKLNYQAGEVTGIKTVTLQISGEFGFGYLKGENGVHRLVRISPFDSNAKRHTSFASVYVHPLIDDSIEIQIAASEITWETMRSGGAGGQSVNKLETAVRLRHIPTGIMIENSETRSQLENKEKALRLLKSRLYDIELDKKLKKQNQIESNKKKIEWGSQIRNYVMHPYKMVKDVRTGEETSNVDQVMNGDINSFLKSYLMMMGKK